mgnify:CR=1 FL=1
MDTKKLRQKILDLAIHGKLVPQDPTDEPASVLLERIKAEKERLIKEGKIKRSKKSAKTSDTPHYENVPFEIPNNWVWTTVAEISKSILYGVNESAKICGAYKLLRITDIQEDNVDWDTVPFTNYDESKVGVYLLEENDILFARTGATVGKSYLVKGLCESSIYASYLIRVQTFKEILPQYVKYFFESGFYWEQIERGSVGIGQPNVNGTTLGNLRLPIPPINEQERIVSELKKWIAVITSIEANKNDLQGYIESAKSKILDLAIHGKLVPQDPNDEPAVDLLRRINPKFTPCDNGHYTFDVPSGWITTNLGSIFNVVSAKRILKSDWKHSGVPFYRAREIAKLSIYGLVDNELYISEEHYNSLKEKFPVPKASDIMISAVGTIGKCYIVKESDKFYYKDASVLCLCNDYQINTKYIYHIMRSEYMLKQMYDNSKGTTVDTITIEKAKQYILPLPPLAEQQRIVAKIEETFSIFDGIQNSLEA